MSDNLDELRAAASKVLAEEAHEFGWHVGTEATTYGTLSHVYTPDRMTDLEAHRIIATNMSDTDGQYLASLHPARILALLSRLEQAEQAIARVREMSAHRKEIRLDYVGLIDLDRALDGDGRG